MKCIKYFLLIFFLIGSTIASFSQGIKDDKKNITDCMKSENNKIVVLPFYDYTGSSMKYLSSYIPELISGIISEYKGINVIDPSKLDEEISSRDLNPEALYKRNNSLPFLREINARVALGGRYIIDGKVIRIDYYIIYPDSGKIVKGSQFEGALDETILDTVERFAETSSEWFTAQALKDLIKKIEEKKKTRLKQFLERLKGSKIGIVFRNKWLFSLFILLSFYFLSRLAVLFIEKVVKRITSKTNTTVDDEIIAITKKPLKWILIFSGIKLSLIPLGLSANTQLFFSNLTTAFIIAAVTYLILKGSEILIRFWGEKVADKIDSRIDDDLIPLFVKISKIFILIMGTLLVLSKFGVEIGPLVASLGIAGFAIGFAIKDSLANIIGGVILILDKSFVVGDKVEIDGDVGVIKEVGLRNTKLQTYDNEIIVIPNGELMNKKFKNYVLPDPTIRVVVNFGVAYGTDVDRVEEVVMDVIKTIDDVVEDPAPSVVFYEMADFALNFQAKFWIPLYDNQYGKWIEATKKIYKALNENNINIPFPTHTVFLEKSE